MNGHPGAPLPACPSCSDPDPRWEIASPVAAEDRVRLDAAGMIELGLFKPEEGLEPLGRPVVRCVACGAVAGEDTGSAVLRAAVSATHIHRTPGDA